MTRSVAYVLTHHPCAAQTFVRREIEQVQRCGVHVEVIALNSPGAAELRHPGAEALTADTFYVKAAGPLAAVRAVVKVLRLAPLGLFRLLAAAVREGATDLRCMLWRALQLVEACLVWERCVATRAEHLHAHFAQASATVAQYTAAIGRATGRGPRTWSFTVHGVHDVVDTPGRDLAGKVADAGFTVTVCDWLRGQVMRVSDPVHWPRIHVVRCGLDLETLAARSAHHARSPDAPARIVCLGRLSPEKGQLVLLDAAAKLRSQGRDIEIELIGAGPDRDRLESAVDRLGLGGVVHMTGELDPAQVAVRLHMADVLCSASFAEGVPVSIMEAMAIGVPVVATAVGGVPELAQDHRTALTVVPGNPDALAAALAELLDDPDLARRLVDAARCTVGLHHDIAVTAQQLTELFATIHADSTHGHRMNASSNPTTGAVRTGAPT